MDSLHERLARLALSAAGDYGFCLAGGYAVQAHGFLDRPSEDVDLFTTSAAEEQFPEALTTVIAAYKGD
jgi:nucleotidyltransferase AbiEii toxin of type IV toxin-antitoxin system